MVTEINIVEKENNRGILYKTGAVVASTTTMASAAVVNASGGLARSTLNTTQKGVDIAFNVVKACYRFGFKISKDTSGLVGLPTLPIELLESFTMEGIDIGHQVTSQSLSGSSELIRVIQQFFGDPFAMELAYAVVKLVSKELVATGKQISLVELWQYVRAWINVQEQTREFWNTEYIYGSVKQVKVKPFSWKLIKQVFKPSDVVSFPKDPAELLPIIRHFARFANGCYGERGLEVIRGNLPLRKYKGELEFYANYCGINTQDIVYLANVDSKNDLFDSTYVPRYCLSIDHAQNTIVLAFRGTLSARDVLVDMVGDTVTFTIGDDPTPHTVHRGVLQVATRIIDPSHPSGIYPKVKEQLELYSDYSLSITGHSLGAAVASLVGILWADPKSCRTRKDVLVPNRIVRVYAYACPSIMSLSLGELCKNLILTSIIGWDWLARVTHAGVQEIRDAAVEIMKICKAKDITVDQFISDNTVSVAEKCRLRVSISKEPLPCRNYPPGKIYWIHHTPENPEKYMLYKVEDRAKLFGQILFAQNMLDHHQPFSYEALLEQIVVR
jgi:hypothetical protein